MLKNRILALCLAFSMCIAVSGCAAVVLGGAAAGGTYVYITGQAKQKFNADLGSTYKAALKACQDLNLTVKENKKRLSDASIKALDVDKDVFIDLTYVSTKVTEVTVRYGILGDEDASRRILSAINKNF
ncbi:DUF3568 domain-containing protein [Maridesulfovibrio salexigens]|uniref:DUF3568 domain-containing protein n=1 Tax=Maridesulfovibrio salexigens (strain ATCC 14822 / DSM 2638 / NCIMB 8403 / VKM B-1763) TaxID=526222 RepID=C6BYM7_MARSD|nr:DUF3568 domain-containing protein [Maridesulfovibrio salexigens]ACS80634.1 conserved hypothetical protein [Maridesulfovibrio salexigens DSM 2638]